MGGDHGAVGCLIEFNAELVEPLDGLRRVADQLGQQLALGGEMAAAEGIEKVDGRRIVGLVGRLDTALGHHGVGVADAQLGDDHGFGARAVGLDGSRGARAAAADDQHVNVVADIRKRNILCPNAAVRLQHFAQLMRDRLPLVGADPKS